ncbi:MAG: hypothetical protein R6V23_01810, partial [Bacteroidales bacterium]
NKFNDSDWLPIYIRRNQNILESVTNELSKVSFDQKKVGTDKKAILKLLQSVYLDNFKPIYLLFDQFEELFIFGNQDERKEFVDLIDAVNQSDIQCKCLFVLREEYLANITEFERTIPEFFQNRIRIEKMSPAKALETITGPCKAVGIEIEEQVADDLLQKVSKDKSHIELTYLQVLLDKVYQLAEKESKDGISISREIVQQIGDVEDILGDFLEQQIKTFENSEEVLYILKSFVSVQGTKKQVSTEEVHEYIKSFGQDISDSKLLSILQSLVSKRILKEKDDQGRYELIHDALAAKIFEKFTLVEKEMIEVRQFVENAYLNFEKRQILLNDEDLQYLDKYRTSLYLPKKIQEFYNKSINYKESKKKVVKYITAITTAVFAISMVLLLMFLYGVSKKDEARELASNSLNSVQSAESRLEKAIQSYEIRDMRITQKAFFSAYYNIVENTQNDPVTKQLLKYSQACEAKIVDAKFSKDGSRIHGYLENNQFMIWDLEGNVKNSFSTGNQKIIFFKTSVDNNYIATVSNDSMANIWSPTGDHLFSVKTSFNKRNTKDILRFLDEKKQLVCLSPKNDIEIYDLNGNSIQKLKEHDASVNSVAVSYDERFIATASSDHSINIWYYNTVDKKFDVYNKIKEHEDTIWSVAFAKNNQYILMTSADSSAHIWSINGEFSSNTDDYFIYNNYTERYGKVCYAQFSQNETAIILTRYDVNSDSIFKTAYFYDEMALYYSIIEGNKFDYIDFDNDNKYSAVVLPNMDESWLIWLDKRYYNVTFKLATFKGIAPQFSNNGNYLMTIDGSTLRLFPVNIEQMINNVKKLKLY